MLPIPDTQSTHFNPRSPHGERQLCSRFPIRSQPISIHAPRTGSDQISKARKRPLRISIHAPRTGSDQKLTSQFKWGLPISIHAPRTGSD